MEGATKGDGKEAIETLCDFFKLYVRFIKDFIETEKKRPDTFKNLNLESAKFLDRLSDDLSGDELKIAVKVISRLRELLPKMMEIERLTVEEQIGLNEEIEKLVKKLTISKEDLESKDQRIWKIERNAFAMMKNVLLIEEKYKGKFVAIHGENIVDYDVDDRKLAKRVYEKYGYRPIYFGRVIEEIKAIEVPSPEYG